MIILIFCFCIVCGFFDFLVICMKNKLLLNLVKDLMWLIFCSVEKLVILYVIIVNIKYKFFLYKMVNFIVGLFL